MRVQQCHRICCYVLLIPIQKNFLTPLAHACYAGLIDAARILLRHLAKVEGAEQVKPVVLLCSVEVIVNINFIGQFKSFNVIMITVHIFGTIY